MRTKRIEMYAPARVWSEVPHGARAAVLRPEMYHERAHIAVRQISNATQVASGLLAIVICYSLIGQPADSQFTVDSQFTLFLRF